MKIAICDDIENDRNELKALLEAYGQDFEIREYDSGDDLCGDMDFIRRCRIVFLDINMDDIIYIETDRHRNVFYTQGRTFNIYRKLDELEEDLRGMGFVRIHKSFLINMKYIERISSYCMVLTTGKEISVPKSRYPEVKRQYTLYKGA